jgi:hypothetical protein
VQELQRQKFESQARPKAEKRTEQLHWDIFSDSEITEENFPINNVNYPIHKSTNSRKYELNHPEKTFSHTPQKTLSNISMNFHNNTDFLLEQ